MTSVHIHGFGPNGELSPGAEAALTAWAGPSGGTTEHDHDTDYYTKAQVDALVSGSSGVNWGNLHLHATANMVFGNAIDEPAVFLFAGDSITADGKWDEYLLERLAREYTPSIADTYTKITYDNDPWTRPTNAGIYGYDLAQNAVQATQYMRSGLVPAVTEDFQPQIIFHGIGTNDHLQNIDPAITEAAVDDACLALDAVLDAPAIHVIWAGMTMVQTGKTYTWAQRVEALANAAAIDPARRVFIDFGPYFDALGAATGTDDWWALSGDGIHPSERGQRMLAELMHRAMHGAPPVGIVGPAASPALPYSGTTTTTTTAATTTTTTTAGTTTTTTTAATTTTTTTAGADFAYLGYERKTSSASSHTFAGMDFGAEAAARTILAVVICDGHYVSDLTIGGVTATQDHAQTAGAKSIYVYRATVPTGTTGDVVANLAGANGKVSVGLWRASGAVTERTSAGHSTGATMSPTSGDFCVYGFIGGDTVTNCTERARSTNDSSIQIVADRVAPGGSFTATSGTGMAAAAGAAYYLTP